MKVFQNNCEIFYIKTAFESIKNAFANGCKFDLPTKSKYLTIHVAWKKKVLKSFYSIQRRI